MGYGIPKRMIYLYLHTPMRIGHEVLMIEEVQVEQPSTWVIFWYPS
jgi:hypothetical protein